MATSIAREKFNQIISASKVFKLMSQADQAILLSGFEKSSDDQLIEAIKAIQEEDQNLTKAEQDKLAQAQQQIALSEQLHADLKHSERQVLVSEEAQDTENNVQALQNIETQLNTTAAAKANPKNPKKFLGLF